MLLSSVNHWPHHLMTFLCKKKTAKYPAMQHRANHTAGLLDVTPPAPPPPSTSQNSGVPWGWEGLR